ncbi:hypothetical protein H632_c1785p0, partial [Helicosporidium sp. ATCC 50920]
AKRVHALDAEGNDTRAADLELWSFYRATERLQAASAIATDEDGGEPAPAPPPAPTRVIEFLTQAKGDVDVIVDLIQALEAQQSLTTAHLPSGAPAASPTVTLAARLAAKKTRARAARERLSQARSALSARCASDDAFFERVRNLGAAWSLQRGYPRDTSVAVSVGAGEELGGSWLRQGGLELGRNRMLLRNGGGGEVCCDCEAAHKPSGEGPGLALGQEAVEESLRRRRQSELWRGVGAAFERAGGDRAWVSLARRAAEQCKARALGASGPGSTNLGELNTLTPLPGTAMGGVDEIMDGIPASRLFGVGTSYTYDDVIMLPGHINFGAHEVDLSSRVTKGITLATPLVSSPMDTVTEGRMAAAMAALGGLGIVHYNCTVEEEVGFVRSAKQTPPGVVHSPAVLPPSATLKDLLAQRASSGVRSACVTEDG